MRQIAATFDRASEIAAHAPAIIRKSRLEISGRDRVRRRGTKKIGTP